MLGSLFVSFLEICLFGFVAVVLYQIFLSDWVDEKRAAWKDSREKHGSINKIALVKLVSDDPKGIEKFVTTNAQYLSDQMVQKLVARIEEIKAGNVIMADDLLKTRFAELESDEEEDVEVKHINRRGI
jgi:uncharacterized membrane protein